jgi:hypothetical protein
MGKVSVLLLNYCSKIFSLKVQLSLNALSAVPTERIYMAKLSFETASTHPGQEP